MFCKLVQKKAPASLAYEDEDTAVLMDTNPIATGHVLVVPKRHSRDLFEIDEDSLQKTVSTARVVARAMKRALAADGVNLLNSSGRAAEQSVFHFHIHVIPRWEGDKTSLWDWWYPKIKERKREELDQLADKIRRACSEA